MKLMEQYGIDIGYFCLGLSGSILILFIMLLIIIIRQNVLKKKYNNFMKGDKDVTTMEQVILSHLEDIERMNQKTNALANKIIEIDNILLGAYKKMSIIKYNAFREMGGNLSFVLVMLDSNNNGFLLNSVHSKDSCYTYVKDIVNGKSKTELSEEEKQALEETIRQK